MVRICRFCFLVALLGVFLIGFRVQSKYRWDLVPGEHTTLWLKFDENILNKTISDINLGGDADIWLAELPANQRFAGLVQLMVNDYNGVETSFLRMQIYPSNPDFPEDPPPQGTEFSITEATNRTIFVRMGTLGLATGLASTKVDSSGKIISCDIVLADSVTKSAKTLKATLTHEVGHCLGIDHNHMDNSSIMSYSSRNHRLGIDDRAALTYLYPADPAYADELLTFGMMCQRVD